MFGMFSDKRAENLKKVEGKIQVVIGQRKIDQLVEDATWKIESLVSKHLKTLARRRTELTQENAYGVVNTKAWNTEVQQFFDTVIKPALSADELSAVVSAGASQIATKLIDLPAMQEAKRQQEALGSKVDIDLLDPIEYELYCAAVLAKAGWKCKQTPKTGDQGADVLATKGRATLVVQCKKYSANVGNTAVQEVVAAKLHFRATHAAVVTNVGYTRSARELASTTGTLLLSHSELIDIDNLLRPY